MYDGFTRSVAREYEPVFEVRRQRGTLMRIYKNTMWKPRGTNGGGGGHPPAPALER
jgi:hypothetical protein